MKTKRLLILFAVALVFTARMTNAQIINPDFSTWTADELVPSAMDPNSGNGTTGWWEYNMYNYATLGSSPISVLRCDTAYTGSTYSARIQTVVFTQTSWNYYKSLGVPFIGHDYSDTLGILFNGNVNATTITYKPGFPCTQKITLLSFYYLYAPKGVDSAECRVSLVKLRNPIAGGLIKINKATTGTAWQLATINLSYIDTVTPDTMYILFSSSSLDRKPQPGSVFWIDNVSVTLPTGINEVVGMESSVEVYPNPASGTINFHIAGLNSPSTLTIFDITGKKINSMPVHNDLNVLNTGAYNNGLYFYQVSDNTGSIIKSGKFSIIK
ncbi:MAG: T9SS type A sorting domain-containing protein [Bacteroidia bacterium]